jgi:hypothetical protein
VQLGEGAWDCCGWKRPSLSSSSDFFPTTTTAIVNAMVIWGEEKLGNKQ